MYGWNQKKGEKQWVEIDVFCVRRKLSEKEEEGEEEEEEEEDEEKAIEEEVIERETSRVQWGCEVGV